VVLALGTAGLGACATPGSDELGAISAITYQSQGAGGGTAMLQGLLGVVDHCLVVEPADGFAVVYWPSTSLVVTAPDVVTVFGKAYRLGEVIDLRGDYTAAAGAVVPSACQDAQATATMEFTVAQR